VIDCLEFDRDLRRLDPVEEIANLALGCSRLERADLAGEFLRRYRNAMRDPVPDGLLQFYMSQRAVTGAKVAAWHVRDPMYVDRQPWIARANSYLDDAMRHVSSALREFSKEKSTVIERHRPSLQ
jgi:aminoglycoside phosphotransferase family enzyme